MTTTRCLYWINSDTSGLANIDYFRCIAKYRHTKIHRNSKFSLNPDVFQLISREYTCFLSQSAPAQAGFTMICAEIRFGWEYVATRVAYFDRFREMDTSELPIFMEFRCILFLDTSESDVLGASRCILNIWFYAHTSEMPDLGPFRCIITLVSIGDTSGLRFRCPSRCTWVQI